MATKGNNLDETRLEQVAADIPAGLYTAPQVEVIDIKLTQNILQGSPTPAQQNFGLPTYEDDGNAW
ncbi:MAG: hypothetical protein QM305_04355 [Bacteroidota bacterium]|jgi:hypothetical protein|nr:hypothetical protein [Bacteroidota bacterium]